MKIIPGRRTLVVLLVCTALAAPAGYLLRKFYTRVVLGMSEAEVTHALDHGSRRADGTLLDEAWLARRSAPAEAVKLLQKVRQESPESYEAGAGHGRSGGDGLDRRGAGGASARDL